ncbi:hypothetical protein [Flavobacterium sp. W21_SRS_FM6]|uniref:hypothetical protein n=1 Tax=Flavobacterium sp. W21_SRS_FM6 TaxID=3240268 RepID=UPI003F9312C8
MLIKHYANKNRFFIATVIIFTQLLFVLALPAQAHPLEQLEGLKRFNRSSQLLDPQNTAVQLVSSLDIKEVKIGQNVVSQAIELNEKGGEIHNITGGSRSDKVTFSFFQPFQESTLEQRIDLHFDKNSGFIDAVNLRYLLSSAYLSIDLIRDQVLQSAISKYGSPLTMQAVQDVAGKTKRVTINDFSAGITNLSEEARAYFKKLSITRNAKISADKRGIALFQNGFDECYLWPKNNYAEILSLCAFAPGAANANNRGLEFELVNFPIKQVIAEHQIKPAEQLKLSL